MNNIQIPAGLRLLGLMLTLITLTLGGALTVAALAGTELDPNITGPVILILTIMAGVLAIRKFR